MLMAAVTRASSSGFGSKEKKGAYFQMKVNDTSLETAEAGMGSFRE